MSTDITIDDLLGVPADRLVVELSDTAKALVLDILESEVVSLHNKDRHWRARKVFDVGRRIANGLPLFCMQYMSLYNAMRQYAKLAQDDDEIAAFDEILKALEVQND